MISGAVVAWPIVATSLIVGSKDSHVLKKKLAPKAEPNPASLPSLRWLSFPTVLYVALVLLTQYPSGGGMEWGGRYLSLCFVPLGVLAAIRLHSFVVESWMTALQRVAILSVVVVPAFVGAVTSYSFHDRHQNYVQQVSDYETDVVVTDQLAATRIAWSTLPTAWYWANDTNLEALIEQLADAEVDRVVVYGFESTELSSERYHVQHKTNKIRQLQRR